MEAGRLRVQSDSATVGRDPRCANRGLGSGSCTVLPFKPLHTGEWCAAERCAA